jgi:hypothetical protein
MTEERREMTAREAQTQQHTRNDHMESSDSALRQRTSTAADFIERLRSNQQNRRLADGSIMPRVTTGNTMAAWVIIDERAAEVKL